MRDVRKIIVLISSLFLSFMVGLFGSRLIYFYKTEHNKKNDNKKYTLIEYIKKENNMSKEFYMKNKVKNNYVYFNGLMYRILYVGEDYISVISDNNVTKLKYGEENNSNIDLWLKDNYLYYLNKDYLKEEKASLLDKETFIKTGSNKSFVIGDDFWTKEGLVISSNGTLNQTTNYGDFLGVRPVIKLKDIPYIKGNGSKKNPYILEKQVVDTLNDVYVGQYIKYKNMTLRVIGTTNDGIKVFGDKINKHIFSKYRNNYNIIYSNDIGYYLNNEYIKKLDKKDLVKSNWYIGEYNLDYKSTYNERVTSYIGLMKVGDYFISDIPNSFILTKTEDLIYSINKDGMLYQEDITASLDAYPVFTLNKKLKIKSGNGYQNNPYVVGELNA